MKKNFLAAIKAGMFMLVCPPAHWYCDAL